MVGAPVRRVEDPAFLTGRARYVGDLMVPGTLEVAFLRSTCAHGDVTLLDTSGALEVEGVVAVLTAEDLQTSPLEDILTLRNLKKTRRPALSSDRVRFVGEAVAMVVAETRYAAEDAVDGIIVEYRNRPVVTDPTRDPPAELFDHIPDNTFYRGSWEAGDVDATFEEAEVVFRDSFHTNRYTAAPMETRGCLADYDLTSGSLTFWASTQCPHLWRNDLARALGMPEGRLRVIAPAVGGGFGVKAPLYPEDVAVAAAARLLGRPLRWLEDRREHLLSTAHAKEQLIEFEAAVRHDGTILGMRARFTGDAGAFSFGPYTGLLEPLCAATLFPGPYTIQNYQYEVVGALTNKTPVYAYRGVGWSAGQTAREVFLDDIARELDIDPVELRRRNMIQSDQFPYETCTGMTYDSGSYIESVELALAQVDYAEFRRRQAELRKSGRYLGIGISPFVESTSWGTQASYQSGFPGSTHDNTTVTMDPSGTVTVAASVAAHGQGHETTLAQLAADVLGVDLENVRVVQGDTAQSPFGMGTFASRSAVIGGGAVLLAAQEVRDKLRRVAAELLEASPDDVVIEAGRASIVGSPSDGLDLAEVATAAYFAPEVRQAGEEPLLAATRFYDPVATYSNGCVVVCVEADSSTGEIRLDRIVAVEDCGTMINPTIIEGQIRGGIAQGLGGGLLEELVYDSDGQLLTTTFMDYLLPGAGDVPDIEVEHIETPSPFTIAGIKGMAEGSTIATPAAVVNAIVDALAPFDASVRRLPVTPEDIWRMTRSIDGRRESA
jgi:carbon-monoxide dehydrogenase large subunit